VQLGHIGERPQRPSPRGNPRRILEDEAQHTDERCFVGEIEFVERHEVRLIGTLLIRDAALVATFDADEREIRSGSVFIADRAIAAIGPAAELPQGADRVIDARNLVILPGLVNTHHHFTQTLTRALPRAQDVGLFDWLVTLYPIWARIDARAVRTSTAVAIAELMLSGCTTASDHTYLWPAGTSLDDQIDVAHQFGLRFHAARGSMSIGRSRGGLPPDNVVEDEGAILRDSQRLIESRHDAARFAMTRIVLAPCSPFSVSSDLMRESAALARSYGVHLHTHLCETFDEERFCIEHFGMRPVELAAELGWIGPDVWHAHMVHCSSAEIAQLGRTRTGAAHCPNSNMRLGSGIAPLGAMAAAGMRLGLGVDGSASNDASHLLGEVRAAMLLQRVGGDPGALTARAALRLATRGGAEVLGRDDIGALEPGMAADLIGVRIDTLAMAGAAVHDPLAAIVFTAPPAVDLSVINGCVRVEGGVLTGIDLPALIAEHNRCARELLE
jgi:8-oxoguanine deaminase